LIYYLVSNPTNGALSNCFGGTTDLSCLYTPHSNFNGTDSFTYHAWDGQNFSDAITVNITVTPVNDAPTLSGTQLISVNEDDSLSFTLNAGNDIENDSLSYIIVSGPSHGTLSCTGGPSRACSYTPAVDFHGNDEFSYKVNDGNLDSA